MPDYAIRSSAIKGHSCVAVGELFGFRGLPGTFTIEYNGQNNKEPDSGGDSSRALSGVHHSEHGRDRE